MRSGWWFCLITIFILTLSACSDNDYINAVPGNSIAVVSIDMAKAVGQAKAGKAQAEVIKKLFKVNDVSDCGIDFSSKIYFFESVEGNLGLVAKVSDDDDLDSWLNKLAASGLCSKTSKRSGCRFSMIKDSWVAGFNSKAVVIMGPVIASQEAGVRQQIIRYIDQDEDDGLKSSPLYDRLDSIEAPVAMVSQVAALPDDFAAPFMLGAPKDADASQIIVAAGMNMNTKGCLEITGAPFSLNKSIDQNIQKSISTLRPITQKYIGTMSTNDALGAFMNVDGKQFINILHSNKAFMALLAGINTAIDMDNIIKSINGDMAIVMPQFKSGASSMRMSAKLGNTAFLSDVDYWKKSCPKGGHIDDIGKNMFRYSDGSMNFVFGVTRDNQFCSGNTLEQASLSVGKAAKPLSVAIQNIISGKRISMVLNINALLEGRGEAKAILPVLKPLLGDINTIVYSVK